MGVSACSATFEHYRTSIWFKRSSETSAKIRRLYCFPVGSVLGLASTLFSHTGDAASDCQELSVSIRALFTLTGYPEVKLWRVKIMWFGSIECCPIRH